jgi:riboflavin synthase
MFTGIIEETGKVEAIRQGKNSVWLKIRAEKVLESMKHGDSINTNGVCLTVISFTRGTFEVDVMAETMRRTNLGQLQTGQEVNLERALLLNDRLGGHMVSGHIDGTGVITGFMKEDIATRVDINAPENIIRYIMTKGSVAIDGISLTVTSLLTNGFSVSLIPYTAAKTNILKKQPGDTVNIECDMIAKYVRKFLTEKTTGENKSLDYSFLKEHGFTD